MITVRRAFWAGLVGLALVLTAPAQEKAEEIASGFRAHITEEPRFPPDDVRNRQGRTQDLVTEYGLSPVIAVFSKTIPADANHPLVAVLHAQDELAEKYKLRQPDATADRFKTSRLGSFLVFLSLENEYRKDETRDARKREIAQFVAAAKPTRTTIGLAEKTETPDGTQALVPKQVQDMGVGAEDEIVIVFYNRLTVVKRWKFKAGTPPTDADLAAVVDEVTKIFKKK